MPPFVTFILVMVGLAILWLIRLGFKLGPAQLDKRVLARTRTIVKLTVKHPGEGWETLGSMTEARGLDLKFEHDNDPEAQALFIVPQSLGGSLGQGNTFCNSSTVTLGHEMADYHTHSAGFVFRVRMKGTGGVAGRKTVIQMVVDSSDRPVGGRIENDPKHDPAVGDWIVIESMEVLKVEK